MASSVLLAGPPEAVDLVGDLTPWTSSTHRWTSDADGSSWDLTGLDGGQSSSGLFLMPGTRGYQDMPPIVHYRRKTAAAPGSTWRGANTDERSVYWQLEVFSNEGSQAWINYNRRFWSTLHPDKTGVWSITQPGEGGAAGETRHLRLRFDEDGDPPEEPTSELFGWADYGISFTAEQPFWFGEPIRQRWTAEEPRNYYGGGVLGQPGFGPPYVTSASVSLASATVSNPGDVELLPTWTVFGPSSSANLGVAGKSVVVPFALNAGEWLRINTARTDRRAMFGSGAVKVNGQWTLSNEALAGGVNRTRSLGAATKFGEIPPGQSVPLTIALGGYGGSIDLEMLPLYYMGR